MKGFEQGRSFVQGLEKGNPEKGGRRKKSWENITETGERTLIVAKD